MTFATLSDRAADIYEYFQANPFINYPQLLLDGVSRGDGLVLVQTEAELSTYPPGKAIVHDSPLRCKGQAITLDPAYAASLLYQLASELAYLKHTSPVA